MGRSIYFTEQELRMLREYAGEAVSILGEGEDTSEQTELDLYNGLGSALKKLYKGCNGEKAYSKYKTQREVR